MDFFLVQIVTNAASALARAVSVVIRWPLLGLVVGTALGRRTTWRRSPDLLRGYQRASWAWVVQYVVRLAVFVPLFLVGQVVARVLLTWPLVAVAPIGPAVRAPRHASSGGRPAAVARGRVRGLTNGDRPELSGTGRR